MPIVTASPTVAVVLADAGTVDWNNVNNVLLRDGALATATGVVPHLATITSHAIKLTAFTDLSGIADSDTINSLSAILYRKADRTFTVLTQVSVVENGVTTGAFTGLPEYWTETLYEETISSLSGLTSNLPSASVLKSSTSGLVVSCTFYDADSATLTASIDDIRLAVDYTPSSVTGFSSWDSIHYRSPNQRLYHRSPNRVVRT